MFCFSYRENLSYLCVHNIFRLTSSICKPAEGFGNEDAKSIQDWIQSSSSDFLLESTFSVLRGAGDSVPRHANVSQSPKKSLLNKLDTIARGKNLILQKSWVITEHSPACVT